jgi:transposase
VRDPTFWTPHLDALYLLDRLGLTVAGQLVAADHTVLACRVVEPDDPLDRDCWCRRCGAVGVARDTVVRKARARPTAVMGRRHPAASCVAMNPRM